MRKHYSVVLFSEMTRQGFASLLEIDGCVALFAQLAGPLTAFDNTQSHGKSSKLVGTSPNL
jgi:hypothetical protein